MKNVSLNININFNKKIVISQVKFNEILKILKIITIELAKQLFKIIIIQIDRIIIQQIVTNEIEIKCPKCGKVVRYIKRCFRKDERKIKTSLCKLIFPYLQMIGCKRCGHRFSPLLLLLGIEKYIRISVELKIKAVYTVLHTTYLWAKRIIEKGIEVTISKMSIWRAVQEFGKKMKYSIDEQGEGIIEIDGTGIPTRNGNKRGSEMKLVVQHKKKGSVKLVGIGIGEYKKNWGFIEKIIENAKKKLKEIMIVGDGDVFSGIKKYLDGVKFQRDLWHIYHRLKYLLWEAGIKRTEEVYREIVTKTFGIIKVNKDIKREEIDEKKVKEKLERLNELIMYIKNEGLKIGNEGLKKIADYLRKASGYLFTFLDKKSSHRILVKTSSLIERLMREINFRIDVAGSWSDAGALNITKLRLGVVYNKIELENLIRDG